MFVDEIVVMSKNVKTAATTGERKGKSYVYESLFLVKSGVWY